MKLTLLFAFVAVLTLVSGCLSPVAELPVTNWTLDVSVPQAAEKPSAPNAALVRLTHVLVRAPYESREMPVLRADGSLAYDPLNQFPSVPSLLMMGPVTDVLRASGRFADVVPSTSAAVVSGSVEVEVRRLALDCRTPGCRAAVVELDLRLLTGRGHAVVCQSGSGRVDATEGRYGAAFAQALSLALTEALGKL